MQAIKRRTAGIVLAVLLLGGLVGPAVPAIAAPTPMQTVEVGWSWWLVGPYARFDQGETETLANMGVVAATAYVATKVPTPWGKVAAAALAAGIWSAAKQAVQRDNQCVIVVWTVLYRAARTTDC